MFNVDKSDKPDRFLSLLLLGQVSILGPDSQPIKFRSKRDQALLIYLATETGLGNTTHRREKLMNLFWADYTQKSAQVNLRQALYRLRKSFAALFPDEDQPLPLLITDRQTVQINQTYPFFVDSVEFNRLLKEQQLGWPEAFDLYSGDFLSDFHLPDANPFEDWAVTMRESLRLQFLDGLTQFTNIKLEDRSYSEAEKYARQQLDLDPLSETAYRQLMKTLALTGQRSQALTVFESCRRILRKELGVDPSPETTKLFKEIQSGSLIEGGESALSFKGSLDQIDKVESSRIDNVPKPYSPLIGREPELAKLNELLLNPDIRLVTLVGPGGIGKTRLATAIGNQYLSAETPFVDGVLFVPLTSLYSADQIISTLAETLGFKFETGERQVRSPRQQLVNYLHSKHLLIILDNFEHLLDGAELVAELLSSAPELKIIATSREHLHLHQEQIFPIQGLEFPQNELTNDLLSFSEYSAVKFFLQCARRIQPNYEITLDDLPPLNQICKLCDGMPLALELAASWVNILSLSNIAAEIEQNLTFLQTKHLDTPRRHWNIIAVFESAWKRLSEAERKTLSQISVFRGGFTLKAVQALTEVTLPLLAGFTDKSLLYYEKGERRYQTHELFRQYTSDNLAQDESFESRVRTDHCEYFCQWLADQKSSLKSENYQNTLAAIESDIPNIRAAWRWAVANGKIDQLLTAADSLGHIYELMGQYQEGEQAFGSAVVAIRDILAASSAPESQIARANKLLVRLLTWQATYNSRLGKGDVANEILDEGLRLINFAGLSEKENRDERAFLLGQQGYINRDSNPQKAFAQLKESLKLYRKLEDRQQLAHVLRVSGNIARFSGKYSEATKLLEECLTIRQDLDNPRLIAQTLTDLSWVSFSQGNLKNGERLAHLGYQAHQNVGDKESLAAGQLSYGLSKTYHGKFEEAYLLIENSVSFFEKRAPKSVLSRAVSQAGQSLLHLGKYAQAYEYGQRGLAIAENIESYTSIELQRFIQSWISLSNGSIVEAERLGRQSAIGSQIKGDVLREGLSSALLSFILRVNEDKKEAKVYLRRSVEIGHTFGAYLPLLFSLPVAALFLIDEGKIECAVEIYSLVESHPVVGSSHWWRDTVRPQIDQAGKTLSTGELERVRDRAKSLTLWNTADNLLNDFLGDIDR